MAANDVSAALPVVDAVTANLSSGNPQSVIYLLVLIIAGGGFLFWKTFQRSQAKSDEEIKRLISQLESKDALIAAKDQKLTDLTNKAFDMQKGMVESFSTVSSALGEMQRNITAFMVNASRSDGRS